ncbi:MAG: hypothetical protein M3N16_03095 [Actinomycetota bacterium]|nr:hypothetical protein [Actinomycetota bacterium]
MGKRCVLCGVSLNGRRSNARFCSDACRAEASRLLSGEGADGYLTLAHRLQAAHNRTRRAWGVDPNDEGRAQARPPVENLTSTPGDMAGGEADG